MKVEFETDYRDFAEVAYEEWKYKNPTNKRIWSYFYTPSLIGLISVIPVLIFGPYGFWASIVTFFSVFFVLRFYFFRTHGKQDFLRYYHKLYGDLNSISCEIELDELGITARQFGNAYFCSWNNIVEIKETDDRIFFLANSKGHITSIPKKAFNSPAETSSYLAFAKSRILNQIN